MNYWWTECGTAGCAIGWYMEKRKPANLRMGRGHFAPQPRFDTQDAEGFIRGFEGLARYFSISASDALKLFDADHYARVSGGIRRSEVQSRIRAFVASKLPPKTYRVLRTIPAAVRELALCC